MTEDQPARIEPTHLPAEFGDRFRRPVQRFLAMEAAGGATLLVCTAVAVMFANSPYATAYDALWDIHVGISAGAFEYGRSLREWLNDGLMTLFFFLVALELKRELALGELRNPRKAALSIAAALGGMLVPAALYLALQWDRPGSPGWGTVMATDTAFVLGALALLGSRIPQGLRIFMLSVAIVDDVGAILVVAVGYSEHISWMALLVAVGGISAVRLFRMAGVRGFTVYIAAGILVWCAVDASGIHATVTGVVLGLMTPARRWVSDDRLYSILHQVIAHPTSAEDSGNTPDRDSLRAAEIAARETLSPVERLEMKLHAWVNFLIMPLFALANAGLQLTAGVVDASISVAVFAGFVFGKPLGILAFCWLAIRSGLALRPLGLSWPLISGGALLGGIGFTMALFIANLAFDATLLDSAKRGILFASIVSALAGMAVLSWTTRRTRNRKIRQLDPI